MTGEPEPTRRADAVRNRAAVIDAATGVLAENPAASMREIADASGVGRTTVYRHFPTREDLIRELFRQIVDESNAMSRALAARDLPVADALRELAREIVGIGQRYRFLHGNPDVRSEMLADAQANRTEDPFADFLTAAQRLGEVRQDMPIEWLLAMLRGQATAAADAMNDGEYSPERTAELLGQTFVTLFLPSKP
jgi:AcrR family transcriptional regulator